MIKQGDIYLVNLNPTKGKEQKGIRPCLVVSGDAMNSYSGLSIVCPLTSSLKQYFPDVVLHPSKANGLSLPSEVLVAQLRTIDQERLEERLGRVSPHHFKKVMQGVMLILTR